MAIRFLPHLLGKQGENLACKYLKKQGYTILKRNYRCACGEVDIIAQTGEVVAFIEVKTRTDDDFAKPRTAVNATRRNRYHNVAKFYFYGKPLPVVRFDVIEVIGKAINHIPNAF